MMDVVMNLLELMENFAVYKERVLKYILHERNVWGFAFSLVYAGADLLLS